MWKYKYMSIANYKHLLYVKFIYFYINTNKYIIL